MTSLEQTSNPVLQSVKTGKVRTISGKQTISVILEMMVRHPVYGKYVRRRTKLAVHDPANAAKVGDTVEIVPCRRLSKTKSWRLVRVISSAAAQS
ncbi:MAG: 30S ribosomal protein S17 [Planctomycetaceae bacterium]|nr:30S ribosomal protein S17 [Planctomycetaceae bacterium]